MTQTFYYPYHPALHAPPLGATLPTEEWYSDEPPLETDRHREQIDDLIRTLKWWWQHRRDVYVSGNLTIYYNPDQKTNRDFRGPDFFLVLDTDPRERRSWMIWNEEYRYPNLIIELLSPRTAQVDRTTKKELYQDQFQTPEYFWFDPSFPEDLDTLQEFEGFRLMGGQYQPIPRTEQGWMWSEQMQLYLGVHDHGLRFFTSTGERLPTSDERAEQERQRAEQEHQRAELERQRAELEFQRAELECQRAEQERQEKEQAQQQIEQLRQRLKFLGFDGEP